MSLRDTVLDLPPQDRLPAALDMLDRLTGEGDGAVVWAMQTYGLTAMLARLLVYLARSHPRVVSLEAMMLALYDGDPPDASIMRVMVSNLRAAGVGVTCIWGVGYRLTDPIIIPPNPPPETVMRLRNTLPWTPGDDAELLRMQANGSDISAAAEELGRTERACLDRWRIQTGRGRGTWGGGHGPSRV